MKSELSSELLQRIKERTDIVAIISEHVALTVVEKDATMLIGTCPFVPHRALSFITSEKTQRYHCCDCEVGGDVIDFVMKAKKLTYEEAVMLLAHRAGIEIEKLDARPIKNEDESSGPTHGNI